MKDYNFFYGGGEESNETYPDFFFEWDNAVSSGNKPGFYEPEELTEIIEIYIINNQIKRAKQAINYAFRIYSEDEELIYEILLLLNDYECWNDLLILCEQLKKNEPDVWVEGHRLTALLHLGMEEEAFVIFIRLKKELAGNHEDLSILYQAMAEALCDVDLFESSVAIVEEAMIKIDLEIDINLYWLQLQCYVFLLDKKQVLEIAEIIQKLNPFDAVSWHRLGLAYQDIDEQEKAIEAYEYSQSLGHDPEEILMNLIYAYDKNKNFNKALEKTKEYLEINPDSYVMSMMAAKLCSDMQNWNDALKYIDITLRLTPDMESLYIYKSNFLLNLEEYKKAKLTLIEGMKNTKDLKGSLSRKLSKLNKKYPDY